MKKSFFVLVFTLVLFTACNTELKLARQFVDEYQHVPVAVYFPEAADVKVEYNTQLGQQTEVLNHFSADLFLDLMYAAYAEEMRNYSLDVYVPENPDNVQVDSVHWLVMLSRVEITGRIMEYVDYLFDGAYEDYSHRYPLNVVNVASWFEMNDSIWKPVLFHELNLMDGFKSNVDESVWSFQYDYTIDTLETADVYNFAVYLGKLYAPYTFDYMMNSHIGAVFYRRYGYLPSVYVRYDPYKRQYRYAVEEDKFVEIE